MESSRAVGRGIRPGWIVQIHKGKYRKNNRNDYSNYTRRRSQRVEYDSNDIHSGNITNYKAEPCKGPQHQNRTTDPGLSVMVTIRELQKPSFDATLSTNYDRRINSPFSAPQLVAAPSGAGDDNALYRDAVVVDQLWLAAGQALQGGPCQEWMYSVSCLWDSCGC